MRGGTTMTRLRDHLPEYLIEAACLGMFMVSAGLVTTVFEYPGSWLHAAIGSAGLRRALIGVAMGLTCVALVYSPWGRRSGAHMNPSVTLAFWRLGKTRGLDATAYIAAQFLGGLLGVLLVHELLGEKFSAEPVAWVTTLPGEHGATVAFLAEVLISFGMMMTVLRISASRYAAWTGIAAGTLVALYITLEAPLSGMSMNPARSFASVALSGHWQHLWIYLLAPLLGMQLAAQWHRWRDRGAACAKLMHTPHERCIHCGHVPATATGVNTQSLMRSMS